MIEFKYVAGDKIIHCGHDIMRHPVDRRTQLVS